MTFDPQVLWNGITNSVKGDLSTKFCGQYHFLKSFDSVLQNFAVLLQLYMSNDMRL